MFVVVVLVENEVDTGREGYMLLGLISSQALQLGNLWFYWFNSSNFAFFSIYGIEQILLDFVPSQQIAFVFAVIYRFVVS